MFFFVSSTHLTLLFLYKLHFDNYVSLNEDDTLLFLFTVDSDFLQGVKKVFGSDEKKEFVDPYFIAGFAGTKVCASTYLVCVSVLYPESVA